jgi:regulator of sigma E protease
MASLLNFAEYAIPFLIVLTILVFVHELGHFLVARYNKVKIEVFSIGFGPELFGWNDSSGTRWKFSIIPLGGYVRMFGDADASSRPDTESIEQMSAEEKALTLQSKPVSQRLAISAAGPAANFLFAIVVLAGLFMFKGEPFISASVGGIAPGKIAEKSGLKVGDKILSVNDEVPKDFYELRHLINKNQGQEINVKFQRDSEEKAIHLKLVEIDAQGHEKPVSVIGIAPPLPTYNKVNPVQALTHAVENTWVICANALTGIGQMIIGKRSSDELGGILSIGDMAGKSAKGGVATLLFFMAFLSINLGLINLFPIPVLDGGHLLLDGIEGIRGKPVSEKAKNYAFMAGLAIVLSVMLMSTWNDIVRLILK